MPQEKSLSPEKQLLKLIENPKAQGPAQAAAIKHLGLSLLSLSGLKARFSFLKDKLSNSFKTGKFYYFNVKTINISLGLVTFVLAIYFVTNLLISLVSLKKNLNLEFKIAKSQHSIDSKVVSALKAASYYLEKIRARDIFKMGSRKKEEEEVKVPSSKIIGATQNLKLVGISWSGDPDAMIEDTKALRTFFVKRGQMIGEVKVQAIFKDRVVLSYEGEELELR
jgi:hypothetical protein